MKGILCVFIYCFLLLNVQLVHSKDITTNDGRNVRILKADKLAYSDNAQALKILRDISVEQLSNEHKIQYALVDLKLTLIAGNYEQGQKKLEVMNPNEMPPKYQILYYKYAIQLSQILGDYVKAFQYLNFTDYLSEKDVPLADWTNIILVAASLNIEAGSLKVSKYWLDKAQAIADKTDDFTIKCKVMANHVYWLKSQEKYTEFSNMQKYATDICLKAKDLWTLRLFKVVESFKLAAEGNYFHQELALLEGLKIMDESKGAIKGDFNYKQTQLLLAESYVNQGKLKQGEVLVTELYDIFREYDFASDLATLHRLKSMIAKQQGDNQRAFVELNKSIFFQDKYDQAVNENQLLHLNAQFASANNKLQNQLDKLVAQRVAIDEEIIRLKAFLTYAIAFLTLIGVAVATSMYMRRQYLSVITADKYDALTGLLTLQGVESELDNYSQINKSQNNNVSLALISIDELAMIKHSFSVDKADRVLANTAAKLTESISGQDVLFRYDDDTFALIVFPRSSEDTVTYLKCVTTPFRPQTIARLKQQTLHLSVIYTDISIAEISSSDTLNVRLNNLLSASNQARRDEQGYVVRFDN